MTSLRLKALLAKVETVYGTDAVPTAADDGVQLEENFWNELEIDFLEGNLREEMAQRHFGRVGEAEPTGEFANITAVVALKGAEAAFAAANLPEWDPLHRACGHAMILDDSVGTETVTYRPRSTGFESATLYAYAGGLEYQIVGARGTVVEEWNPGGFVIARYSLQGIVQAIAQVAVPAVTYAQAGITPPTVKAAGMAINSFEVDDFASFEFDAGLVIATRRRGNAANAHAGYVPTDYNPTIRTTIERPPLASLNPYLLRRNATLFPWTIGPVGAVQYNRLTRSGPAGRMLGTPHSEDEGLAMMDLEFRAQHSQDAGEPEDAADLVLT